MCKAYMKHTWVSALRDLIIYTKISQVVILYWPSWLSVAMVKLQPNHGGGARGFTWLKGYCPSLRDAKSGTWSKIHGEKLPIGLFPMAGTSPSTIDQQDSCLQANLRKAVPSVEGPSFHVTLACVKKTGKLASVLTYCHFWWKHQEEKQPFFLGITKLKKTVINSPPCLVDHLFSWSRSVPQGMWYSLASLLKNNVTVHSNIHSEREPLT